MTAMDRNPQVEVETSEGSGLTAGARLSRALDRARSRGESWPCRDRDDWMSDSTEVRTAAARECVSCPVLALCHAAAEEQAERWGVWGGLDRETARKKPSRRAPAEVEAPADPEPVGRGASPPRDQQGHDSLTQPPEVLSVRFPDPNEKEKRDERD